MTRPPEAQCRVEDNLLQPCTGLGRACNQRGQGIRIQTLMDMNTGKLTRSFAVLRSGDFAKNGIVLNVCPFCGERISEHVARKGEP